MPALYSTFHDAVKKSDGSFFKKDKSNVKIYDIIDGLQRLTTIFSYLDNKWATSDEMDKEDAWVYINDEEYNIEGKFFKDQHPAVQDKIKSHFSDTQLKNSDNETALLQSMMLLDNNYEFRDFSAKEISIYSFSFNQDVENKENLIGNLKSTLDFINSAEIKKAKNILNKTHFPIVMMTAQLFIKEGIDSTIFAAWLEDFSKSLKGKGEIPTGYKEFMKGGSTKRSNVLGKIEEMERHCKEFLLKKSIEIS